MELRLEGKVVLVTGATQGIGRAIAETLAHSGAGGLLVTGREPVRGNDVATSLSQAGTPATFIAADLADTTAPARLVDECIGRFGRIDALVNAAATSARGSLVETSEETFDQIFQTNVRGPFFLMQALVAHLLDRKAPGSIVNVLSTSAHCGQSFLTPYSSSKGALMTLTKNVANAYRSNRIRCNAVLPGWMDTEGEDIVQKKWHAAPDDWLEKAEAAQPMGQLVKPDQLARLISYMVSPQSGVMTGSLVDYDQNVAGAGAG
ncbi:MAG: SDR family oxidoreductase [Mesorhizobium sp.]|nr:MAG: SDR family oxidoreductase [Mesorhizobium sp.]